MNRTFRPNLEALEDRYALDAAPASPAAPILEAQQATVAGLSQALETPASSALAALDREDATLAEEQTTLAARLEGLQSEVGWAAGDGFAHRLAVSTNHQNLYDTAVTASGLLVGAYKDGSIEIRSLATGAILHTLQTKIGRAQCLTVAAGTDMVFVSAGAGPTSAVIAINALTGQEVWRRGAGDFTNKLSVSPDGTRVVVDVDVGGQYGGSLGINAQTGASLGAQTPQMSYGSLALSGGRTLYFSLHNRSDVFVREADGSQRHLTSLPNLRYAGSVAPDGVTVAIAGNSTVRILHTQTGAIRDLAVGNTVTEVRFMSDGSLAVGREDGMIEVWSADGKTRTSLGQAGASVRTIRETPNAVVFQTSDTSPVWYGALKPSVAAERSSIASRLTAIALRRSAIEGERTVLAAEALEQEAARIAVFTEGFDEAEELDGLLSGITIGTAPEQASEAAHAAVVVPAPPSTDTVLALAAPWDGLSAPVTTQIKAIATLRAEAEQVRTRLSEVEARLLSLPGAIDASRNQEAALRTELEAARADLASAEAALQRALAPIQGQLAALQSRLQWLTTAAPWSWRSGRYTVRRDDEIRNVNTDIARLRSTVAPQQSAQSQAAARVAPLESSLQTAASRTTNLVAEQETLRAEQSALLARQGEVDAAIPAATDTLLQAVTNAELLRQARLEHAPDMLRLEAARAIPLLEQAIAAGHLRGDDLTAVQALLRRANAAFASSEPATEDRSLLSVVGVNANQLVIETSTPLDKVRVEIVRSDADGMRWHGETMRVFAGSPSEETGTTTLVIPFHNGLHGGRYAVRLLNADDQQIEQLFVGWSPEGNTVTLGVESFPSLARLAIADDDASPSPTEDDRQAVLVAADARTLSVAPTLARSVADYAAITLVHREGIWDMLKLVDTATIETIKRELARQDAPHLIGTSLDEDRALREASIETRVAAGFPRGQVESSVSITITDVWNEAHKKVFTWIESQKVATAAYVEFLAQLRNGRLTTFNPASLTPGHRLLPSASTIEQAVASKFLDLAGLRDIANHDAAQMLERQEFLSVSEAQHARDQRAAARAAQRDAAAENPALALQMGLTSAAPDQKQLHSDLAFLRRVLPLTAGDSAQTQKLLAQRPHAAALLVAEIGGANDATSRAILTAWETLQNATLVAEAGESDSALQERVLGGRISVSSIPSSELLSDAPRSFELAPGNIQQFTFRADSDRFLNVAIANLPYATTVRLLGAEGRVIHTSTRGAREGVTISASIPAGTYTVSIEAAEAAFPEGQGQIGPVARGYALTLTAGPLSRTQIEGVISREGSGEVMPVSLSVAEFYTTGKDIGKLKPATEVMPIDPARPVWVVVHGRDSSESKDNIEALAFALFKRGYQVVTVDWAEAARDFSYSGFDPLRDAQWTPAVGRWVASQLDDLRIPHTNVSFVGHSHGSYVSYFAAVALGATGEKPHNLVALDPARDPVFVGGFDESQIDFSTAAANSTAIKANVDRVSQALALQTIPTLGPTLGAAALGDQFEFGDENLTRTARYHYELVMPGMIDPFQAHSYPIERFIRAIQEDQDLSGPLEM